MNSMGWLDMIDKGYVYRGGEMTMFHLCNIEYDKGQAEHLHPLEPYIVSILVNGRFFKDQLTLVRSKVYGTRDVELSNDSDGNTTIYFNNPFFMQGVVNTVDVIVRDQNGEAINAFLNVELLNV